MRSPGSGSAGQPRPGDRSMPDLERAASGPGLRSRGVFPAGRLRSRLLAEVGAPPKVGLSGAGEKLLRKDAGFRSKGRSTVPEKAGKQQGRAPRSPGGWLRPEQLRLTRGSPAAFLSPPTGRCPQICSSRKPGATAKGHGTTSRPSCRKEDQCHQAKRTLRRLGEDGACS